MADVLIFFIVNPDAEKVAVPVFEVEVNINV
jgi:hypothetical protein